MTDAVVVDCAEPVMALRFMVCKTVRSLRLVGILPAASIGQPCR